MRRLHFAIALVVLSVMLVGCTGALHSDDGPDFRDERTESLYEEALDGMSEEEAAAFENVILEDGSVTPKGERLLDRLVTIDEVGAEQRDAVARSTAAAGEVSGDDIETIDRLLDSPEEFTETALADGLADSSGSGILDGEKIAFGLEPGASDPTIADLAMPLAEDGYDEVDIEYLTLVGEMVDDEFQWRQAEAFGLLDDAVTDGHLSGSDVDALEELDEGIIAALADEIDLHSEPSAAPVVAELSEPLVIDGLDDVDLAYLSRVVELSESEGHAYEGWAQAEELGLFHEAVDDGTVTEEEVWALENDADNRLLNGMEVAFGTDPEKADTSGDGFEDHLKWGPMRDLGLDVTPDEPDVYVEVESDRFSSKPTANQQAAIESLFSEEPADHHGPINVHFHEFRDDVDPVSGAEEMDERAENRSVTGLGFHYLLMTDRPYYGAEGDELAGEAFSTTFGASWMVVVDDGTIAWRTTTIAHELGHALGIGPNDFDGVDADVYPATEYNSVMNYNIIEKLTFSTGDPFDDYAHMYDREFGSYHTDSSELDAIWESGEVPEEQFD